MDPFSPTTRSARTCPAPCGRGSRRASCSVPAMRVRSTSRPAARSLDRRAGRCRAYTSRCGTARCSRPASRSEPYERAPPLQPRAAHHRRLRDARVRDDARHPAVVAADRDDERVSRRRHVGRLAGGRGEHALSSVERRPAALPLRDRSHAAMTDASGALATMHPAYFAMVMATGIVSIACHLAGLPAIAPPLVWLNIAFYIALWILTAARIARFRSQVVADVFHHGRSVGFFTTAAATCVLGTQLLIIYDARSIATLLWFAGILLWALITYTVFTVLTVKRDKPSLADGINGGWLVSVVAPQAVRAVGPQLASGFGASAPHVLFFSLAMWLGGGMLYIWLISLIVYRYLFFTMSPSDLAPPYWINMGAVAISTLAGTLLVLAAPQSSRVTGLLPFVKGLTLMFWATATWWIPMLVILGIWRHVYERFPLRYDPLYWGAVFPLGMYTVCTFRLAQAVETPFLFAIPRVFVFVALAAWALVAAGLIQTAFSKRRRGSL